MARLTEQEREGMDAELAEIPDWGGAGPWLTRGFGISRPLGHTLVPGPRTPPPRPKAPTPTGDDDIDIAARVTFDATVWRDYLVKLNEFNSKAIAEASFGDIIDWNGNKWMFVGLDPATDEIWLAVMAGVKKRPEVVEPGEAPRRVLTAVSKEPE
jgi:hypothetical protein